MAVDAIEATMDVIAPLSAGLVGMILLPALLLQAGRLVLARVGIDAPFMRKSDPTRFSLRFYSTRN
jgi:hypothetical protein